MIWPFFYFHFVCIQTGDGVIEHPLAVNEDETSRSYRFNEFDGIFCHDYSKIYKKIDQYHGTVVYFR